MGGLVLVVAALLAAAGAYEMYAGSGDILSERGWSAFIAGAVFVSGGVVTAALGLVFRALEALRAALRLQPAVPAVPAAERLEPAAPTAAAPSVPEPPEPAREPSFEAAPTAPMLAAPPIVHATEAEARPMSPEVLPVALETRHVAPEHDAEPMAATEPHHEPPPEAVALEPHHDDWLDHSFAELDREMTERDEPAAAAAHPPVEAALEPAAAAPEPPPALVTEEPHDKPHDEAPYHHAAQADTLETTSADHATVSAREEPAAPTSAVIGRYESEGTSYVMYADGSIDAQSEAGVYRFASMAELKAFIES